MRALQNLMVCLMLFSRTSAVLLPLLLVGVNCHTVRSEEDETTMRELHIVREDKALEALDDEDDSRAHNPFAHNPLFGNPSSKPGNGYPSGRPSYALPPKTTGTRAICEGQRDEAACTACDSALAPCCAWNSFTNSSAEAMKDTSRCYSVKDALTLVRTRVYAALLGEWSLPAVPSTESQIAASKKLYDGAAAVPQRRYDLLTKRVDEFRDLGKRLELTIQGESYDTDVGGVFMGKPGTTAKCRGLKHESACVACNPAMGSCCAWYTYDPWGPSASAKRSDVAGRTIDKSRCYSLKDALAHVRSEAYDAKEGHWRMPDLPAKDSRDSALKSWYDGADKELQQRFDILKERKTNVFRILFNNWGRDPQLRVVRQRSSHI